MTRLALWSLALALGIAGWVAIVELLGLLVAGALACLYLVLLAAVVTAGGINAALMWLERRPRG